MAPETSAPARSAGESAPAPRVLVGTSGYSYDDWVGPFYPQGTARHDFLSLYAREFPVVELNFSYYQQPNPRTMERMLAGTASSFTFALKAHKSITHEIGESGEKDVAEFRTGIQPMVESGRLAAVLLQFPYSFAYTPKSRSRLALLCGKLEGLPLAVEFRKSEWLKEQVFEGLRRRGVSLVSVDEPDLPKLLPPVTETTGRFGYVRFHGRNREAWWTGDNASRYDYLYTTDELEEWVQRIRLILEKVPLLLLFFNNHWRGNAAQNAREMRHLLQQHGLM
jgi:uncharacterized protein YecE (DUF72 family)